MSRLDHHSRNIIKGVSKIVQSLPRIWLLLLKYIPLFTKTRVRSVIRIKKILLRVSLSGRGISQQRLSPNHGRNEQERKKKIKREREREREEGKGRKKTSLN